MKTILLTILYSTLVLWTHAQNDSIRFYANIIDAFTGAIVEDGEADVLAEDSSSVSKGKWSYNGAPDKPCGRRAYGC